MNPGEIVRRKKNLCLLLVAVGFGAMAVLAFMEKRIPPGWYKALVSGAVAVFAVGNVLLYVGIRCPKCGAMLGVRMMFSGKAIDRCPRCSVDFRDGAE